MQILEYEVNHDILKGKSSIDAPPHPQPNKVKYRFLNRNQIPIKEKGKKQIYAIIENGRVIGVGETTNMLERIPNGYAWCIRTMKPDGSTIIKEMQQRACKINAEGGVYQFEALFLEQVDTENARIAEAKWINHFITQGEPILNKTR